MTSNRVDQILRTIDETLDVGAQTPVPDPSFGEISPRVNGLCVRCQRVEPSGDAGYCDRCRAIVLGDVPEQPPWTMAPGLGDLVSPSLAHHVADLIAAHFSRRILAVGGPLDGQVPDIPPHANWFDWFDLIPIRSGLEIIETVRYHRINFAWGGMVHDVWLVEDDHADYHLRVLIDRLGDWREACEALTTLRWVWGPRAARRGMRYRCSISRPELESPYGWDLLCENAAQFVRLMDVEARRAGRQLDPGSLVWWMSPPQVGTLGAFFVDLRCEGLAR